MNAIRNGAQGLDDLTNYVMAITNTVTAYNTRSMTAGPSLGRMVTRPPIPHGLPVPPD